MRWMARTYTIPTPWGLGGPILYLPLGGLGNLYYTYPLGGYLYYTYPLGSGRDLYYTYPLGV